MRGGDNLVEAASLSWEDSFAGTAGSEGFFSPVAESGVVVMVGSSIGLSATGSLG